MATKGEMNRQRIISTADDLFYRQGYARTSFTDIADAADIARGNFYYYYKSKDEILAGVLERRAEDVRQLLADWEEEFPASRERLRRYVQILIRSQDEVQYFGCPMGSLSNELAKQQHGLAEQAHSMFSLFRDWLIEQFRALGHEQDARELAMHLLARTQGVAMITNAYHDQAFLQREVEILNQWIDTL